ncbi:rCG32063, partial [Rattus norvegicus]
MWWKEVTHSTKLSSDFQTPGPMAHTRPTSTHNKMS